MPTTGAQGAYSWTSPPTRTAYAALPARCSFMSVLFLLRRESALAHARAGVGSLRMHREKHTVRVEDVSS